MASCVTRGPQPRRGCVLASQAWPGSLHTGPGAPASLAAPGSPPKLNAKGRGLAELQMLRALTQCLRVLCRDSCGPRGGSGTGSDLCVVLVFNQLL